MVHQDTDAAAALDRAVAAQGKYKKAQSQFDLQLEHLDEIYRSHKAAAESDQEFRQSIEDLAHHHGRLINDSETGPWLRHHLAHTLGWTIEQITEFEEAFR